MRHRTGAACFAALSSFVFITLSPMAFTQPPGGKGGFGPPGGQERKILKDFDKNTDGWLNKEERSAARESLKNTGSGKGGFGKGGFGKGGSMPPAKPGPKVEANSVKNYPDAKLYDPTVLRTVFLEFENPDWEKEIQDFHGTDVDVPATLIVDGKRYPNVGVHFRGMSSYMAVSAGYKRSLNVSLDLANPDQRLYGYKTLNLLNSHSDSSMMSTVLYSHIARQYLPTPKANFVKVVINGESWGVYVSAQQFDKEFLKENYNSSKGTRWKVRGSPGGGGGLEYLGEDIEAYKRRYEMKSGENEKAWKAFANLCKVLNQTPVDRLPAALEPILDVDSLLWFLALDVALINNDGYWVRASDYALYLDEKGKFHVVPHDMNEAFRPAGGPGFGGPGGGFGFRPPPPGVILPLPLQNTLQLTDEQRQALALLQKEADETLAKVLNEDQRKQLQLMKEGNPPPGGPGGPPGGMGTGGPGGPGGASGRGVELDSLVALNDASKPLRSKVLAVPAYRTKYLADIRTIATEALDWKKLGPVVDEYRMLIEKEVESDTRKLDSFEAFRRATAVTSSGMATGRGGMNLRNFAEMRQKYLLSYPDMKKP